MSRITKKNVRAIKNISVAADMVLDNFHEWPVTALKAIQDVEKEVKRQVLDILYNESKERK